MCQGKKGNLEKTHIALVKYFSAKKIKKLK
jgi:hypothetical protein